MTKKLKGMLASIGSVMDVAPKSGYGRFVPRQTPEERMRGHWQRSGDSIRRAMGQFENERPAQSKPAER